MAGARGSHGGKGQGGKNQGGKSQGGKSPGGKRPGGTRANSAAGRSASKPTRSARPPRPAPTTDERPAELPAGPFRLGAVAGTTPGKWIDTWHTRLPQIALELVSLTVPEQRDAVRDRAVDAALVRLPIDRDGLHVIPLYDEVAVVVCAVDSHLTAADTLTADDLAGEVVIVPRDAVIEASVPGAVVPVFAAPETTEEAVATVAAGVGVVIMPMSLARLHHRRDVDYRPLVDGPTSTIALAWPVDEPSVLVETFVGIVRGRTANSSRD